MPNNAAPVVLSTDKEVDYLIKSIEEASKHCRETLIVLLVASAYVLITVFAYGATDSVKLPILGLQVKDNTFLIVGPFVILAPYIYLQICIADLRGRLTAYDAIPLKTTLVERKNLLLFPSIITMGLLKELPHGIAVQGGPYKRFEFYVRAFARVLVYAFVPTVLFVLWGRFIKNQEILCLVPCLALICVIYASVPDVVRPRWRRIVELLVSFGFVSISMASVPSLRTSAPLTKIWSLAAHALGSKGASLSTVATVACLFIIRSVVDSFIQAHRSLKKAREASKVSAQVAQQVQRHWAMSSSDGRDESLAKKRHTP